MDLRPSPTKSATLYKVGTIKTGNDKNKWIITEDKNGTKKWKLYKKVTKPSDKTTKTIKSDIGLTLDSFYDLRIMTPDQLTDVYNKSQKTKQIYDILLNKIIPEINKDYKIFLVPLPFSNSNRYWTDYQYDFIKQYYKTDVTTGIKYLSFVFHLDKSGNNVNMNEPIMIYYSKLDKKEKIKLINLFLTHLGDYYSWKGSNITSMFIYYKKGKYDIPDIKKIKDYVNDIYPYLNITINSQKTNLQKSRLLDFFNTTIKDHEKLWDIYTDEFNIAIYSFDIKKNKNILDKIKKFISSQKYIDSSDFSYVQDLKTENIIWNYKL